MNVALFGGFDKRPIAPGWTKETFVAVFGGGDVDLTASPPEGEGRLTAFSLFGGIDDRGGARHVCRPERPESPRRTHRSTFAKATGRGSS